MYGASGICGYSNSYQVERPYVAIVKDGAGVGRAIRCEPKSSVLGTLQIILPSEGTDVAYLAYLLNYLNLGASISGSTIPHIYFKDYSKRLVPDVTLAEQQSIVIRLTSIDSLLSKLTAVSEKLNILVKSRFFEMFGDPISNSQHLPTKPFIEIVKMQRGYDLPISKRNNEGVVPVYGSNGIVGYHDEARRSEPCVIVGRSGTTGVVNYSYGPCWPLNTTLFSIDTHGNNAMYLSMLLRMFKLNRFTTGTGVPTLNRNVFHNTPLIDVPLADQERFARFASEVDKLRFNE